MRLISLKLHSPGPWPRLLTPQPLPKQERGSHCVISRHQRQHRATRRARHSPGAQTKRITQPNTLITSPCCRLEPRRRPPAFHLISAGLLGVLNRVLNYRHHRPERFNPPPGRDYSLLLLDFLRHRQSSWPCGIAPHRLTVRLRVLRLSAWYMDESARAGHPFEASVGRRSRQQASPAHHALIWGVTVQQRVSRLQNGRKRGNHSKSRIRPVNALPACPH